MRDENRKIRKDKKVDKIISKSSLDDMKIVRKDKKIKKDLFIYRGCKKK